MAKAESTWAIDSQATRVPPGARWRPERPGFEPGVEVYPLQRFSKPQDVNCKATQQQDLEAGEKSSYTPAYKQEPKMSQIDTPGLPSDLAEIIAAWPTLPGHVRAAITTLVTSTVSR